MHISSSQRPTAQAPRAQPCLSAGQQFEVAFVQLDDFCLGFLLLGYFICFMQFFKLYSSLPASPHPFFVFCSLWKPCILKASLDHRTTVSTAPFQKKKTGSTNSQWLKPSVNCLGIKAKQRFDLIFKYCLHSLGKWGCFTFNLSLNEEQDCFLWQAHYKRQTSKIA